MLKWNKREQKQPKFVKKSRKLDTKKLNCSILASWFSMQPLPGF